MAFKQIVLNDVADTTEKTLSLRSSSTVISCVSGACEIRDVSDGGDMLIIAMVADERKIWDYYPGADVKVIATAGGTTVTFGKHNWKDQ